METCQPICFSGGEGMGVGVAREGGETETVKKKVDVHTYWSSRFHKYR